MRIKTYFKNYFKRFTGGHDTGHGLNQIEHGVELRQVYLNYIDHSDSKNTVGLDLGCGAVPRNSFNCTKMHGIDLNNNPIHGVVKVDLLVEPIPFEDNIFDFITAYDFLEHVPRIIYCPERRLPFIELMNEIYRTLKPGGIFLSCTPFYPYASAFRDPTHVNYITTETFSLYFDEVRTWGAAYGFRGKFQIIEQFVQRPHLISILKKI